MASCVVNVLVFLFWVTQVACTALRSRSPASRVPALVVDPFAELSDAELLDEADGGRRRGPGRSECGCSRSADDDRCRAGYRDCLPHGGLLGSSLGWMLLGR